MFDMDGLLLDTERVCRDTFLQTAEDFELPDQVDREAVFLSCIGLRRPDGDKVLKTALGQYVVQADFKAHWDTLRLAVYAKTIPVKAGARELLVQLREMGVSTGVVTSTQTDQARHHLESVGLLDLLDQVIGGDQVAQGKPSPDGYLKMAAHLGHVPEECAAFEDSNTGIRAAVASGARAVQVPDLVAPTPDIKEMGHLIAKDLLAGAKQVCLIP